MSGNNRIIPFVLWVTIGLAALIFPADSSAKKSVIRFATLAPEGTTWMNSMRALDAELRKRSGGEVGFKFYPSMSMGDEKDVLRKMRLGQINAAAFTGFGLGEILPEVRILELPYLFESVDEIDYVTGRLTEYFELRFNERGFVLLGWADVGWIYFFSTGKPVAEPKHLEGLKVWMWEGDPLAEVFFMELGKSPVPLPVTDVHLSLQTGLINAVYCSPLAALALQWFTKVEYVSDVPFTNAIGAVLVDRKTFEGLQPQEQSLLSELSRSYLRELLVKSRQENRDAYQQLIKEGIKPVPSSEAQRTLMRGIGEGVHKRLTGQLYSEELLSRLKALLSEYRSQKRSKTDPKID